MSKSPVVMKRLYELGVQFGIIELDFRIEIAIANSRNLSNSGDNEEHWCFGSNDGTVQLQAMNCCKCGNYICNGRKDKMIPQKITCECV